MKKFSRSCICLALILSKFCVFQNITALNIDKLQFSKVASSTTFNTENHLLHGGIKKEKIEILNYEYLDNLMHDNEWKYITVRVSLVYYNENNDTAIAATHAEVNFRYNTAAEEVECLSASKGTILNANNYIITVFARKANETLKESAGIVNIIFRYQGKKYDEKEYKFTCDFNGNISY